MTRYIGNIPISSIQEVDISESQETDEMDIVDKSSNILFTGDNEGRNISIDFTLVKEDHPEGLDVEEQRDDLKGLASNDVSDNYFQYNDTEYFLSIEDISFPEEPTVQNIREGVIGAKALPWPQNFPNAQTGNNKLSVGSVEIIFEVDGNLFTVTSFIDGELEYSLVLDEEVNKLIASESLLEYNFYVDSESNKEISRTGNVEYGFNFIDVISDMKRSSVGCLQFILELLAESNKIISTLGDSEYSLDFEGEIEANLGGPFGRTFGRQFGGT